MKYSERVLEELKKTNPYQPEFIQAATEVLESLSPVVVMTQDMKKQVFSKDLLSRKEQLCFVFLGLMITAKFM